MKKGFYFSFDALIALLVLGVTVTLLLGTSAPSRSSSDTTVQQFRQTNAVSEDAAQAATHSTMSQAFSQETVDDYVNDTSLEASDTDKSVMDVISILWASNDTAAARNMSRDFFADFVPDGYGYSVSIEGDTETVVFNSSTRGNASAVATARRVVSGVQKDRPQDGYLARARAKEVDKNTTEVFGMPMGGSAVRGGDSHALELNRSFELDAEQIQNATLFLSMRTGGSDPNSIDVEVNGDDAGFPNTWDYEVDKDGNHLDEAVQLNPGSRVAVTYKSNETGNLSTEFSDRKYFTNIETEGHNNNDHGVWQVMSYYVPEGADVTNVTLQLAARDVDEVDDRNETQVWVNDELVNATSLCDAAGQGQCSGEQDVEFRYNLTNHTETGTNVVTVYVDTFLNDDGTISGFGDDDRIELFAAPDTAPENSSYLEYEYERAQDDLVFGKIELARTDRFGGSRSNPKSYNASFDGNASVLSTFVHLAQLDSRNVSVTVENVDAVRVAAGLRNADRPVHRPGPA
ncbi:MAG: hypothetical protein SVW77_02370 [Candidatus Nanohaloarchaea archaeon]|nr:hypothetical protein [Candidatus Nanohaloarchaea archaeon]